MKPLFLAVLLFASIAGAQVQKWEYATLTLNFTHNDNLDIGNRSVFQWTDAMQNLYVENRKGQDGIYRSNIDESTFFKRITGNEYENIQILKWISSDYVGMLNVLGSIGWEFVDIDKYTISSNSSNGKSTSDFTRYFFKRLISK